MGKWDKEEETKKKQRKYRVQKNYNLLVIWFSDVCPDSGPYFWKSGYRCGLVKRLASQVECQMLAMPLESPSGFGLLLMASLLCTLLLLISCLQWEFKFPCRFSAGSMSLSMIQNQKTFPWVWQKSAEAGSRCSLQVSAEFAICKISKLSYSHSEMESHCCPRLSLLLFRLGRLDTVKSYL